MSNLNRYRVLQNVVRGISHDETQVALLDSILNAVNNTIVVTDPQQEDNPIVYVNQGFERLTGYNFRDVLGRNCRFLQGEDKHQAGAVQVKQAVKAEQATTALLRNYRKDGSMFWNELHITPIFDNAGKVVLFTGVQNDVTARETFSSQCAFLDSAINTINEAVLITDTDIDEPGPRILFANPAFERLTGYTLDEVKGRNPRFLQGPNSNRDVLGRLRKSLEAGVTFEGETINYRKDGSEFIMNWHVAPVRLEGNKIDHWVATQRDVTQRRHLERRVLEAASQEQERIARELHDSVVQNITAALMMTQSMRQKHQQNALSTSHLNDLESYLRTTLKETRNLSHQMAASHLANGGLMIALEGLTGFLTKHGLKADFTYETPIILAPEQAKQLFRIAQEATTNALKHAQATTVTIALVKHHSGYTLSISDDGVGISSPAERDSGIGLSNMRFRAQQLNADLTIRPAVPQGTVVSCTFAI